MRALILGAGNMGRAIRAGLEARGDEVVAMLGRPIRIERSARTRRARPDRCRLRVQPRLGGPFERSTTHLRAAAARSSWEPRAGRLTPVPWLTSSGGWARMPRRSWRRPTASAWSCSPTRRRSRTALRPLRRVRPVRLRVASARQGRPAIGHGHLDRRAADPAPPVEAPGAPCRWAGCACPRHARGGGAPRRSLTRNARRGVRRPGESLELRITARDRSAYVTGALLAADTFCRIRTALRGSPASTPWYASWSTQTQTPAPSPNRSNNSPPQSPERPSTDHVGDRPMTRPPPRPFAVPSPRS